MLLWRRVPWGHVTALKILIVRLAKSDTSHRITSMCVNMSYGGSRSLHRGIMNSVSQGERALTTRAVNNDLLRRDRAIEADTVLLIDEDGTRIGEMKTKNALSLARSRSLHVVQMNVRGRLPVCRLMSQAKIWEQEKQAKRKQRKSEASSTSKELKMSSNISDHDLSVKLRQISRFMEEKRPVLVTVYTTKRIRDHQAAREGRQSIMKKLLTGIEGKGVISGDIKSNQRGGRALAFRLKPSEGQRQGGGGGGSRTNSDLVTDLK